MCQLLVIPKNSNDTTTFEQSHGAFNGCEVRLTQGGAIDVCRMNDWPDAEWEVVEKDGWSYLQRSVMHEQRGGRAPRPPAIALLFR